MKLYVASSWRNAHQPVVVRSLRDAGHEVYDFRNPKPGDNGFAWRSISPDWERWTPEQLRSALDHPIARAGFRNDWEAMQHADAGVLVLPCGRSAHLEAGYFVGAGKPLFVLLSEGEPELMYLMATALCLDLDELKERLSGCHATAGSQV
jgi:nucleoside 2-deoxyribosyltransferase